MFCRNLLMRIQHNYTYTYACRNIFNTIKTSGHSSLEKYTSHFIERIVFERELETEKTAKYWPQLLWPKQRFFPVLLGCSTAGLASTGSHSSIIFPTDLNFLSPGLYNNLTSTYFLRASKSHSIQPLNSQVRPLISSTGCTSYLHRCISSFDSLAGSEVNMQHQVLPLWIRVNQGVMAMKGYSAFYKASALLKPHHQFVECLIQDTRWGTLTPLHIWNWCILHPLLSGLKVRRWKLTNMIVSVPYTFVVISISFQTFLYRLLKLSLTLENSVCYCYTAYKMTNQFLWFRLQKNS